MKTTYTNNTKNNFFSAAVLASFFIAMLVSVATAANSNTANIDTVEAKLETIVVTAQRIPHANMETIVVSASRHDDVLVAAK